MRISTDARPTDIEPAANWISGLIGAALDKRVAAFEQQERANPLLATHFRENFALEFALAKARKYRKSTGRLPKGEEYDRLYSFLIPAHRIHVAVPPNVKIPFEGRLRDAVNGTYGARPFAYEISIATHLMQKGWDVQFVDYSGAGRFDRQGVVEIEVECKTTSGDTGRKIHRQEVNRLAEEYSCCVTAPQQPPDGSWNSKPAGGARRVRLSRRLEFGPSLVPDLDAMPVGLQIAGRAFGEYDRSGRPPPTSEPGPPDTICAPSRHNPARFRRLDRLRTSTPTWLSD